MAYIKDIDSISIENLSTSTLEVLYLSLMGQKKQIEKEIKMIHVELDRRNNEF